MNVQTEDYQLDQIGDNKVVISGVLRLPSPAAYDQPFEGIKNILNGSAENCTVDITNVTYLNSSGINALARIVILARTKNKPLVFLAKESIPWQKKSIKSLEKLWDQLSVELD